MQIYVAFSLSSLSLSLSLDVGKCRSHTYARAPLIIIYAHIACVNDILPPLRISPLRLPTWLADCPTKKYRKTAIFQPWRKIRLSPSRTVSLSMDEPSCQSSAAPTLPLYFVYDRSCQTASAKCVRGIVSSRDDSCKKGERMLSRCREPQRFVPTVVRKWFRLYNPMSEMDRTQAHSDATCVTLWRHSIRSHNTFTAA